mmetsp:Transcript_21935/g.37515  ORF Transcript_21935/g.37515 Transcript_21935/m.37515 type:complete len:86 (-) Transcript_21935:8-265(-)
MRRFTASGWGEQCPCSCPEGWWLTPGSDAATELLVARRIGGHCGITGVGASSPPRGGSLVNEDVDASIVDWVAGHWAGCSKMEVM